jgi:hypothetical protein
MEDAQQLGEDERRDVDPKRTAREAQQEEEEVRKILETARVDATSIPPLSESFVNAVASNTDEAPWESCEEEETRQSLKFGMAALVRHLAVSGVIPLDHRTRARAVRWTPGPGEVLKGNSISFSSYKEAYRRAGNLPANMCIWARYAFSGPVNGLFYEFEEVGGQMRAHKENPSGFVRAEDVDPLFPWWHQVACPQNDGRQFTPVELMPSKSNEPWMYQVWS